MSSYANYSAYSKIYDQLRSPIGVELYFGILACKLQKPLSELHVLDAGCGTGNYAIPLLQLGVGKVTMLDANTGMLEKARGKLAKTQGIVGARYNIMQYELPTLPFEDGTFDCVMLNNVLHHLAVCNPDGVTVDKTKCDRFIGEASRVLKPEGVFFLTVPFSHQVKKGVWYYDLSPRVGKLFQARCPVYDELYWLLKSSGFNMDSLQTFVRIEGYPSIQDLEGTFNKEVRESVSWFADFTPKETEEFLAALTEMKEKGTLLDYFNKHDALRKEVGQMTFVTVFKA